MIKFENALRGVGRVIVCASVVLVSGCAGEDNIPNSVMNSCIATPRAGIAWVSDTPGSLLISHYTKSAKSGRNSRFRFKTNAPGKHIMEFSRFDNFTNKLSVIRMEAHEYEGESKSNCGPGVLMINRASVDGNVYSGDYVFLLITDLIFKIEAQSGP